MANKLQFLRGPQANIDSLTLDFGQPAFTDAGKLYIGNEDGSTKTLINGMKGIPSGPFMIGPTDEETKLIIDADPFELVQGSIAVGYMSNNHTISADSTLNVGGTGEKDLLIEGLPVTLKNNHVYLFAYSGNYWAIVGDVTKEYETLTANNATTGTDTTGKLISAKVLADYVAERIATLGTAATKDVGTASGQIPTLDATGKISTSMISDDLLGNVKFQGTWDASTNTPELQTTPGASDTGHYYIVTKAGTFASISFNVGDWIIAHNNKWDKVDNTDSVSSVAGLTGIITVAQLKAAGLEGSITAGTAAQYYKGDKTWADFATSVRAATLTGLTTSNTAVAASDTVLTAIGKLQGQVSTKIGASGVLTTALTGYTAGTNTALAATDTVLSAMGKIQGQINSRITPANVKAGTNVIRTASGNNVTLSVADASDTVKGVTIVGATGGAEAFVAAGTATQYYKGDKTWADLTSAVLAAKTTALTLTNSAVATGDSVLAAIGKLQAQVSSKTSFTAANVLTAPLTGYTVGTNTALAAADTVLGAFQKVQGQISARAPLASPALTGTPTAPTAAARTNNTQIATTAFVKSQGYLNSSSLIDCGTF